MNTKEKYALADVAVEHALKSGAEQVSVTIYDNRSTSIEIRDQKTDSLQESNRNGLSIDIYTEKKYSSHSTNRLKKEDLFHFIEEAIAATRFLAEDEFRSLPDPSLLYKGDGSNLEIFDDEVDALEISTKIGLADKVVNEAFGKDNRILSVSGSYSDNISESVMVTSNGFRGDSRRTGLSLYAEVSVQSETGRPNAYWYESDLFFKRLVKNGIGEKALERALGKINPKKILSGKYDVVIENRVAANLLSPVYDSLTGSNLYNKQSFLIGKEGKPVASPLMTITDDPFIKSLAGSRLYDDEGLAAVKRPIIEKGVLRNYYIDNYYGKKLGMNPTSGSSSNIVMAPGTRGGSEMVKSIKKGVFITGFIGGNCNGSTGDFSYGIEGFYIEDGKVIHPVNEMNITGNMNDFWFGLSEVGNDFTGNGSVQIPSLMISNAELSGI
ncbi:MAG TPA: TldD/PmbA family protein [Bacteroidales bacterium]|nr:TldD/PmbA family protein [Bacteroidales bacterium]